MKHAKVIGLGVSVLAIFALAYAVMPLGVHASGNPSYTIFIRNFSTTYCQVTSVMQNRLTVISNGTQYQLVVFGNPPNTNWTIGKTGMGICYAPTGNNTSVSVIGG